MVISRRRANKLADNLLAFGGHEYEPMFIHCFASVGLSTVLILLNYLLLVSLFT
jgi:protein tyrosine phosphatase